MTVQTARFVGERTRSPWVTPWWRATIAPMETKRRLVTLPPDTFRINVTTILPLWLSNRLLSPGARPTTSETPVSILPRPSPCLVPSMVGTKTLLLILERRTSYLLPPQTLQRAVSSRPPRSLLEGRHPTTTSPSLPSPTLIRTRRPEKALTLKPAPVPLLTSVRIQGKITPLLHPTRPATSRVQLLQSPRTSCVRPLALLRVLISLPWTKGNRKLTQQVRDVPRQRNRAGNDNWLVPLHLPQLPTAKPIMVRKAQALIPRLL